MSIDDVINHDTDIDPVLNSVSEELVFSHRIQNVTNVFVTKRTHALAPDLYPARDSDTDPMLHVRYTRGFSTSVDVLERVSGWNLSGGNFITWRRNKKKQQFPNRKPMNEEQSKARIGGLFNRLNNDGGLRRWGVQRTRSSATTLDSFPLVGAVINGSEERRRHRRRPL
ncbi:hypothetical protein EVAR_71553_1 [Eumeta japonica]|uniref:Uncharacterized protein n=1 Tax=Eumeta variegata TaxID=151549 RepID=A0A4C1SBZ1_EUMVA|nr:hypothetical protein EVAR_71553_1 [Eumeta japonica]